MTPHTDLCRRLRAAAEDHSENWIGRGTPKLLDEAAAALERQAKEIAELRALLTSWLYSGAMEGDQMAALIKQTEDALNG